MVKSLYRGPEATTYQLVHRSQRDPLINDPEASERVLKAIGTSQFKNSKASTSSTPFELDEEKLGDAAAYGIYYDDTTYDYMQHLRTVGTEASSYLVEAPTKKPKVKKAAEEDGVTLRAVPERMQIPYDALPSHPEDEISYNDLTQIQAPLISLQPDLDPSIREVLEALEDEAYAIDEANEEGGEEGVDDFWLDVVRGGEKDGEDYDEEWDDEEEAEDDEDELEDQLGEGLEARVARFKASKKGKEVMGESDDDEEEDNISEGGDTIAALRVSNARRPPRRKAASSAGGSQFSMTSSAMFRNSGLQTLDEQFDQIEKLYEDDSDSSWGGDSDDDDENGHPPNLVPAREDLDEILDDFLSRYEVLGGKIRHVLEPTEGVEGGAGKLDRIRRELASLGIDEVGVEGEDPSITARRREKESILAAVDRQEREAEGRASWKDRVRIDWEKPKERWDCETVLSTYSNVSHHPRLLRVQERTGPRPLRIRIDAKTGFPVVELTEEEKRVAKAAQLLEEAAEDEADDYIRVETITRPRNETPADRKARKEEVKAERLARRTTKATTKEAFGKETKRQTSAAAKKVAGGRAADVVVGSGVRKLA